MMFKQLKARRKQLSLQCFCKEKGNTKKYQNIAWGRSIILGFLLFLARLEAKPSPK
jgi:hypothetical protein